MNVLELIRTQLKHQGDMSFVEFMQQALYAPNLGYYSAGLQKFGTHGDFITAPELTPLFGKTLARQCQQVLIELSEPCLFEFGAGSGRLGLDLLTALESLDSLPKNYYILEVSSNLRQRQYNLFAEKIPHLLERIQWLDRWPEQRFNGVIIANEVLDAMPVHRFLQTQEGILESFIRLNDQEELIEIFKPTTNQNLQRRIQKSLSKELAPYLSEVNLFIDDWIKECFSMLAVGAVFLIDYGFPRHEYYHPDRRMGTLMCHYRHQSHTNPLAHPGEEDITAHVDFTQVAEATHTAGFHVAGYCNQASFFACERFVKLSE